MRILPAAQNVHSRWNRGIKGGGHSLLSKCQESDHRERGRESNYENQVYELRLSGHLNPMIAVAREDHAQEELADTPR